ncbi:TetR/AcrR family transcriptional regulator [Celerinatantimonas sp. MCCC 1A17872]|uniref:TetR/AcrR family transcriptional regulator n=1 Tax=Celerinatantimonas sp. MCCC 1A17872 TaxID=3177514 RepID=UPI0038C6D23F
MSKKDTRKYILDTAEVIISQKGFSAVGINELLQAAEVPKGSFYHYFRSKEAFGVALLEHYFSEYLQQFEQLTQDNNQSAEQSLLAYWQNWQTTQSCHSHAHRCLVVKLAAEVSDLSDAMRQALHIGMEQIITHISALVEKTQLIQQQHSTQGSREIAQVLYQLWLGASLQAKVYRSDEPFKLAMSTTQKWLNIIT